MIFFFPGQILHLVFLGGGGGGGFALELELLKKSNVPKVSSDARGKMSLWH